MTSPYPPDPPEGEQNPPPQPGLPRYGETPQTPPPGYGYPPPPPPGYGYPPPPGYGYPPPPYGYGPPPAPVPGGRRASMGARFGGFVLDGFIVGIPTFLIDLGAGRVGGDVIGFVLGLIYWTYFVGTSGQTIGHRAAGIRVVDANTGGLIGPGRAAARWIVLAITGAICTLGYWSPFFDSQRRQGWHDKAANSVVIPAR